MPSLKEEKGQKKAEENAQRRAYERKRNLEFLRQRVVTTLKGNAAGVSNLFERFDADNSGVIDLEEFKVGLQDFGCGLEEHEISYLYHHIDANGNGELDPNEFAMFLASGGRKASALSE